MLKTIEFYFSLVDVNEIVGLPTYRTMYDEHLPQELDMSRDLLKLFMIFHDINYHTEYTKKHNKK